jgi:DNA-binding transcriptional ArsR family regulator
MASPLHSGVHSIPTRLLKPAAGEDFGSHPSAQDLPPAAPECGRALLAAPLPTENPGGAGDCRIIYALTRICSAGYIKRMESVFEILAEPNRRAILSLLVSSQQSVGEIERQLRLPQPTVSKHLRVLREAGFVESAVDAQRRLYRLRPEPLQEVAAWLAPFRRFWSAHVDALERHLDRMEQSAPTKRKPRRRRDRAKRESDKGETK